MEEKKPRQGYVSSDVLTMIALVHGHGWTRSVFTYKKAS